MVCVEEGLCLGDIDSVGVVDCLIGLCLGDIDSVGVEL